MGTGWTYADLTSDEIALVTDAERSLGGDVVVVYRSGAQSWADVERLVDEGLEPDRLDEARLTRLHELEARLGAVAVAYRRALA